MNPDGISYLDVGASFFRRDWANAINAWWSPLYPWLMGVVLGIAKPSARWEFPLVHLVNFGIFVLSLFAFRFLLHGLLGFLREQNGGVTPRVTEALPESFFILVAYPIFLWIALEVETIYDVSPDLAVMACFCLTTGVLLRLRPESPLWKFALFGFVLGVGYWTKSVLFPLGFVAVAAGFLWRWSRPQWRRGMVVATAVFLCSSAPLIVLLSHQKGRFTFGDSGRINYAWYVAPRTFWRNWQGEVPGSGTPAHPTRQLLQHPPLFEFDGPVVGTYPPWTDPSYWNEGLKQHFNLKAQLEVLAGTVPSELRLLLRARPELVLAVIVLAFISGTKWFTGLRELWPCVVLAIAGMALYLPLVENDRYLGGYVLILFLMLVGASRFRPEDQRISGYVVLAAFLTMSLSTMDYTFRVATNHMAIPGNGPNSTWQDVVAAERLWALGVKPGDKVGVIGDGTGAYWAHLAKVRIVAEIMGAGHGSQEFWNSPDEVKQKAYDAFASSHARTIVASCPLCRRTNTGGWAPIAGTAYCVRPSK